VSIPEKSLIYCDIPYKLTNCGKYQGFDHNRFYEWAVEQDKIFISECEMPDCFIPYAWIEKTVLSAANSNSIKSKEILFTNQRTWESMNDEQKNISKMNFSEQLTLFDFIGGAE
jgi:hypothetical protein